MALSADLGIDYTNRRIYATGTMGSQFYTVVDLYSYLMDTFDDPNQLDDPAPMTAETPFDYTMRNGWYIEQSLIKNLKGGTIKTVGYNAQIQVVKWVSGGYTNAIAGDIGKTVVIGGFSGVLLDFDNTQRFWWVRSTGTAANSTAGTITSGTGAGTTLAAAACITGEEMFANVYTLGTVANGNAFVLQNAAVLTSWWGVGNADGVGGGSGNHIDVVVKIREAGTLIASGSITIFNRNYGDSYDHVVVDMSSGGRTAAPLATSTDIANATAETTIDDYIATSLGGQQTSGNIVVTFGTYNADVDDDGTNETYSVQVDCNSQPLSRVYEALKWFCDKDRAGSTLLNSLQGRVYISANGAYTPVKSNPLGTFAGGKLFGARGVLFINPQGGDASNFQTIDNAGNTRVPPATVSVQVTGLVSGDQVFQALISSGNVVKNQYTLASGNNSAATTVVMQGAIPNDTPTSGALRIVRAGSFEHRYTYTGYTRSTNTFTGISPALTQNYLNTDTAYTPYIDEAAAATSLSKSIKYVADRTTVLRVRRGSGVNKIVPYEVAATIGNNGSAVPALRVADTINNL
jgi:hypothetical protein